MRRRQPRWYHGPSSTGWAILALAALVGFIAITAMRSGQ